ncbi:DUF3772 domain-containing protein [Chachezhania antarctica]|uniref:DUF3772 domain-containing protein n=1 Tax=Chachezhania antarctica TaxID=2340860 RepID=UPI000EB5398C|nr:DUF3772 domain-containing protein [Chachezhania antarctica]
MPQILTSRPRGLTRPELFRAFALCALVLVLAFAAVPGAAQDTTPDEPTQALLDDWDSAAKQAEAVIAADGSTNAQLESQRATIAGYRSQFADLRDSNAASIATLESQLSALGPKPEDGATEADDVARLRADLNAQLSELKAPQVIAEEAYLRANGLVTQIDQILRTRQTDKFLSRDPIPVNPANWPGAVKELHEVFVALVSEVRTAFQSPDTRARASRDLPQIVLLVIVGLALMLRGVRISRRLGQYAADRGGRGAPVWSFLATLMMIVIPIAGLFALSEGIELTGFYGPRGRLLLNALPFWGGIILGFHWLGMQLTRLAEAEGEMLMNVTRPAELRLMIDLLAVMLVLANLTDLYGQISDITLASMAVTVFPLIVITSLLLLRVLQLGVLQRTPQDVPEASDDPTADDDASSSIVDTWLPVLNRFVMFLVVIAPILAAIGYIEAAKGIIFPLILTLALVGVTLILHRFLGNVFALAVGRDDSGTDSLFAVAMGFVLTLILLPFLALVWGARVSDLTELWTRFLQGYKVGGVVISPTSLMVLVIIFAIGLIGTRLLQGVLRNSVLPKTRLDPGGQAAMVSGVGYVGIFLAALIAITSAGFNLSSLAIVAGALSVGVGFGLQTIVSNFVSGIILLIERPVSKGDWIQVGTNMGYVRDISVRATRIETFDRTDVILPNSDLISGTVVNFTRGNTVGRVIVSVGVAYGTDTRRVEKILLDIANSHPMVLAGPMINFVGFGPSSLDFEIRAILRDVNWMLNVKTEMNHMIAERFAKEGIEIPFAQQDLWLRNPEVLPGAHAFHGTSRHNFAKDDQVSTPDTPKEEPTPQREIDFDTDADGGGDGR